MLHRTLTKKLPIALAAAGLAAAGLAAAQGHAAPGKNAGPEPPTLANGLLTVEGTNASERIALRLQAGQPGTLEVDFGDDGTAEFSFPRADVARIAVDARGGDDRVRIDESNGLFTDTIPTTLDGGDGDDVL